MLKQVQHDIGGTFYIGGTFHYPITADTCAFEEEIPDINLFRPGMTEKRPSTMLLMVLL
jgi:hypothetical protein